MDLETAKLKTIIDAFNQAHDVRINDERLNTTWFIGPYNEGDDITLHIEQKVDGGDTVAYEITAADLVEAAIDGNKIQVYCVTLEANIDIELFKAVPMSFDETHTPRLMSREEGEKLYRQLVFDYSLDTPHPFDDVYEIMKLPEANASEENKLRAVTDIIIKMLQCRIDLLRDSVFGEDAKIMTVVETPRNAGVGISHFKVPTGVMKDEESMHAYFNAYIVPYYEKAHGYDWDRDNIELAQPDQITCVSIRQTQTKSPEGDA